MRFAGRRKTRLAERRCHIRMLLRHQCMAIHDSWARYRIGWHAYGSGRMGCTGLLCLCHRRLPARRGILGCRCGDASQKQYQSQERSHLEHQCSSSNKRMTLLHELAIKVKATGLFMNRRGRISRATLVPEWLGCQLHVTDSFSLR